MGAGVDNAVWLEIVRQINVRAGIAKTKLQTLHSRNAKTLAQSVDFRRNHSQVFRYKRKTAQPGPQRVKEIVLRPFDPAAVDRSRLGCWDFLITPESPKVVEPDDVTFAQRPGVPPHPPVITLGLAHVP